MFASNQILEFSGCLSHDGELKRALEFAIKASDWYEPFTRTKNHCKCTYQITEDGRYCIGRGGEKDGWNEFPFDFDLEIISRIIVQHLEKQEIEQYGLDGTCLKGYHMKAIPESFADEENGIKKPNYGIVQFKKHTCFYAK